MRLSQIFVTIGLMTPALGWAAECPVLGPVTYDQQMRAIRVESSLVANEQNGGDRWMYFDRTSVHVEDDKLIADGYEGDNATYGETTRRVLGEITATEHGCSAVRLAPGMTVTEKRKRTRDSCFPFPKWACGYSNHTQLEFAVPNASPKGDWWVQTLSIKED